MKILHIAQMIRGGPASYLQEVMPFQARELGPGNVLVLAPADEAQFLEGIDPGAVRALTGKRRTVSGLLRLAVQARRTIARERPDIVHLHSSFAGAMVRLSYLLWPFGRPRIVYCAHGWAFNMDVASWRKRAYALVERLLSIVTDSIICISQYEYDQALRRGLPEGLLCHVPNGVAALPPEPAVAHVYDPTQLNLLFVGRQDRQKGFDILLAAMRQLEHLPITLHVLGAAVLSRDAPPEADPPANVVQHGWKPREEVAGFMAGADALVMPSRWEGFGLTAVEAMRQGLPVYASAVDALPELVCEGVSGYLFPPDDADGLAALLATLDREALRRMRRPARRWFLENFTAETTNRMLLRLYRSLFLPAKAR